MLATLVKTCSGTEYFEVEEKKDEVKHLGMLFCNETYSWILLQQQEIDSNDAGL